MFNPKTLSLYPDQPGVYLMKDSAGKILYIGKANRLRGRIQQYFTPSRDGRMMVPYLIAQIETIDTIITLTEKDALILEDTLIKQHLPKYNILLKDDKTFIRLLLTRHKWPMLRIVRSKGSAQEGTYFGPYTNAIAARQTLDLIFRLFPLRQCSDAELASRKRPCLLYDIKRCCAPCVHRCTEAEYGQYVAGAMRCLKGQTQEVVKELKERMNQASEKLAFEQAGTYLKMLHQIEHTTHVQHVDYPMAKDCDGLGLYREADAVMIAWLMFREGKIVGASHFYFHKIASNDAEVLETFLLQYYRSESHIPKIILVPCHLEQSAALEEILSESSGHKVAILNPKKGYQRKFIEMGQRNAKSLFIREQDSRSLREKMLLDLQETLQLTRFPRRIDCFDTSNLSGTDPVASLACFIHGEKDKSHTRFFKIKTAVEAADFSAMREVLKRHFSKTQSLCDLLIVDGGKGHLHLALAVFQELGIASVDIIAVAKESARHDKGLTQETIYLPHRSDPLRIDPKSPLLFLLQRIRDEAHRLALSYHKKKRSQRIFTSALDEIPGIGPIKKKRLLQHFGSVKQIQAATPDELKNVPGLHQKDIKALIQWVYRS